MKNNNKVQTLLIVLVLALGLGYAYINSDLNINGTAQVNSANWDVHWANIQVTNGSVSGTNVVTAPSISNGTTVNYSIILNIPGDYYEFTVDAVNAGSIDAMIDTMEFKLNGATIVNPPEYLNYTVTYSDGGQLEENHELKANTTEKYKIRVEYRTDIELNQIPATNQNLLLSFGVAYRQATSSSIPVRIYLYRSNNNDVYIGDNISSLGTTYTSDQDFISEFPWRYTFLRHRIINNQVVQSDVGFVYNNNVYYLISGGATYNSTIEYYNSDSIYYAQNKITLQDALGSSNCAEYLNNEIPYYHCSVSIGDDYIISNVYANGTVIAYSHLSHCVVDEDSISNCIY